MYVHTRVNNGVISLGIVNLYKLYPVFVDYAANIC